jgi:hypothetical protein
LSSYRSRTLYGIYRLESGVILNSLTSDPTRSTQVDEDGEAWYEMADYIYKSKIKLENLRDGFGIKDETQYMDMDFYVDAVDLQRASSNTTPSNLG